MRHTLVAVFDNRTDAQNARDALLSSGFSHEDVRLSGSGSGTGAGTSTGTTADTDADSGFGSGIRNFFSDLFGGSDDRVNRYEGALSSGKNVVTLTADSLDEVERAADIIEGFGPIDIDEHASGPGAAVPGAMLSGSQSGMSSASMSAQSAHSDTSRQQGSPSGSSLQRDTSTPMSGSQSIPVVEEQLKVGKREVQRGGVRIFSRVVETPVNETIGLREEHVDVQRRQVNQPIDPLDASAFKEQTIEMRERLRPQEVHQARSCLHNGFHRRVLGIENPQGIGVEAPACVFIQLVSVLLQVGNQLCTVACTLCRLPQAVELKAYIGQVNCLPESGRQQNQFSIYLWARKTQGFGANLVELAVTPPLRLLPPEHRAHVIEPFATVIQHVVLDHGTHHTSSVFRPHGKVLELAMFV